MFSSFYTHVVLVISCVIFSFSFFSFVKRIQTSHHLFESTPISINYKYQSEISPRYIRNKRLPDTSNEQTNDKFLREKVLGSNETLSSTLHRFTFINPPKRVCRHSDETKDVMIMIVLSRGLNFDYRQAIRGTWGRNGKYQISNIYVQTIFFVGTDDTVQSAIRDEQAIFNDVIEIGTVFKNYLFSYSLNFCIY
jgi:hypothetical protein